MAHFINKYLTQAAYDADSTKQYPNASLVNGSMVYVPTQPVVDVPDVVAEITVSSDGNYELGNPNYTHLNPNDFEYVKSGTEAGGTQQVEIPTFHSSKVNIILMTHLVSTHSILLR